MKALKIAALDQDDLEILAAHVQDAVAKPAEMSFDSKSQNFTLPLRRYVWEKKRRWFGRGERRLAALSAGRVTAVRSTGVDRTSETAVLNLLTIRFVPRTGDDDPSGTLELVFSGEAMIALDVECIELRLADLGAAWQTDTRPRHDT